MPLIWVTSVTGINESLFQCSKTHTVRQLHCPLCVVVTAYLNEWNSVHLTICMLLFFFFHLSHHRELFVHFYSNNSEMKICQNKLALTSIDSFTECNENTENTHMKYIWSTYEDFFNIIFLPVFAVVSSTNSSASPCCSPSVWGTSAMTTFTTLSSVGWAMAGLCCERSSLGVRISLTWLEFSSISDAPGEGPGVGAWFPRLCSVTSLTSSGCGAEITSGSGEEKWLMMFQGLDIE